LEEGSDVAVVVEEEPKQEPKKKVKC